MQLHRLMGYKGTVRRRNFRNGVLLTLAALAVLFVFWLCFFSGWLEGELPQGGRAETIGVASCFCDDICELPIASELAYFDELRAVCFVSEQTPQQLIDTILAAPQQGFSYTAELYTLSGCEDILVTKTRDSGRTDCYLLRRYGDVYVFSRMRESELLIPMHLLIAAQPTAAEREAGLSHLIGYAYPSGQRDTGVGLASQAYGGQYVPVAAGPADFYEFYAATGRYRVERNGDEVLLYGYTEQMDATICPELTGLTDTGGVRQNANVKALYWPPQMDKGIRLCFREIDGQYWLAASALD